MILSRDPITKTTRRMHYSDIDDTYVIHAEQDAKGIIERNKARYNEHRGAWSPHTEWNHYAEIPLVVWEDLMLKGITQDEERLRAWLSDRDNQVFRCRPGQLK